MLTCYHLPFGRPPTVYVEYLCGLKSRRYYIIISVFVSIIVRMSAKRYLKLDTGTALCYNKTTIKSARETSSVTAQQPAKGKVLKLERWGITRYFGSCQFDGSFFV